MSVMLFKGQPTPFRGGWKPERKDPRDKKFGVHRLGEVGDPATLPQSVDLRPQLDAVWNQQDESSCTAHGGGKCARFALVKEGKDIGMPARNFIYGQARQLEGDFNRDEGATVRGAIKSIAQFGVPPESLFPYGPATLFLVPTSDIFAAAKRHPAINYFSIDNSQVGEMLGCLAAGYPFAFGMTLQESFMSDAVAQTGFVPVPAQNEDIAGGHCMAAVGYNQAMAWPDGTTQSAIIVANSWDVTWGDNGYCYIPLSMFLDTSRTDDCWTIRTMQ